MATQTEKLGLLKPTYDEPADIAVLNENMDKIDDYAKALETNIDEVINEALEPKSNIGISSVNSNNSYIKNVPDTSAPYSAISKIGGMSYREENTLKDAKVTAIKSESGGAILTWDGNTEGLESVDIGGILFYKLSDICPTVEQLGNAVCLEAVPLGTDTKEEIEQGIVQLAENLYATEVSVVIFALEDALFDDGEVSAEMPKGIYFAYNFDGFRVSSLTIPNYTGFIDEVKGIIEIPEALQNKKWYGIGIDENTYNFVDLTNGIGDIRVAKQTWIGTESNIYYSSYSGMFQLTLPMNAIADSNGLCNLYNIYIGDTKNCPDQSIMIAPSSSSAIRFNVFVKDSRFRTVAEFRAHLTSNNLSLVYMLETPTTEDISNLITDDNLIGVEGGGTITFENEYGYDVPSEITFYLNNNDVIGANKFVGDLEGTATRAKTAESATKATHLSKGEWVQINRVSFDSPNTILDLDSWYLIEAYKNITSEVICSSFILHTPSALSTSMPTLACSNLSIGITIETGIEGNTYVQVCHLPNFAENTFAFFYTGDCDYLKIKKIM